jgi:hypothetical protein
LPAHLIEQEELPGRHEALDDLDASAFAVADLVHPPGEVDVEDVEQAIATLLVSPPADRIPVCRSSGTYP